MIQYENRASYILYNIIRQTNPLKKIMVPANVCPIVIATLLKAKKKIELIDLEEKTYHMDTSQVLSRLKEAKGDYDALLFVRTYGADLDFEAFFQEAKAMSPDLLIIDDRCLAIPEVLPEARANRDVTLFSTGYVKYVELGFGGYAHMKDDLAYRRIDLSYEAKDHEVLTDHFRQVIAGEKAFSYQDTQWLDGSRPKMSLEAYQKTLEEKLDKVHRHKAKINKIYLENLPQDLMMGKAYNNWRFNLLVADKALLLEKIFDHGLFASSHYFPMGGFLNQRGFEVADRLSERVLNLFNDFRYTEEMAYETAKIIKKNI